MKNTNEISLNKSIRIRILGVIAIFYHLCSVRVGPVVPLYALTVTLHFSSPVLESAHNKDSTRTHFFKRPDVQNERPQAEFSITSETRTAMFSDRFNSVLIKKTNTPTTKIEKDFCKKYVVVSG